MNSPTPRRRRKAGSGPPATALIAWIRQSTPRQATAHPAPPRALPASPTIPWIAEQQSGQPALSMLPPDTSH